MARATMTGVLLSDIIARTKAKTTFSLMGSSLGARVIFTALNGLATRKNAKPKIKDVYLLGGAVDRMDERGWDDAAKAVEGKIYNCYSRNDMVLKVLYRTANAFISNPAGIGNIESNSDKIENVDVSDLVHGHMQYKENFGQILERINGK